MSMLAMAFAVDQSDELSESLKKWTIGVQRRQADSHLRSSSGRLASRSVHTSTLSPVDDQLSAKILGLYERRKQRDEHVEIKRRTRRTLEFAIRDHFISGAKLLIDGSTLNGFGVDTCDLDLCLVLPQGKINDPYKLQNVLRSHTHTDRLTYIGSAKVPILKGVDRDEGVSWEMNFGKIDGIPKTRLLRAYSLLDERVAPLVLTVKLWAASRGVCNAHEGTLSSFSWTLLVICFLQCGCTPAVLPCLHTEYPTMYGDMDDRTIESIDICDSPPPFISRNQSTVGELLLGFFKFYAEDFRVSNHAVSVRQGKLIAKREVSCRPPTKQWQYFCIEEEPYGVRSNTARAMFKPSPYLKVVGEIRAAYSKLKSATPTLDILD